MQQNNLAVVVDGMIGAIMVGSTFPQHVEFDVDAPKVLGDA